MALVLSVENLVINKEMVFSTGHIPKQEGEILESLDSKIYGETVESYKYGWRIFISPEESVDEAVAAFRELGAPCVAALLVIAKRQGCMWLVLDAHGPEFAELPRFNWRHTYDN